MQQQPQVNFAPPPQGQVYEENMQPQLQGQFINPPHLPPGQNRGAFAAPHPHGQPLAPPVAVQGVPGQAPQVGSKLDPIELVNILLRFVAVLMTFIATVIVGATKYFLAANSIVLFYSVATLVISVSSMLMTNQQQKQQGGVNGTLRNKLIMLFVVGDLVMVVFLFSAVGSAAASKDDLKTIAGFFSLEICDGNMSAVCDKWNAGIVMSMFGAVAYLLLELLSVFTLTKMNNNN